MYAKIITLIIALSAATLSAQWTNPNPSGAAAYAVMVSSNGTLLWPDTIRGPWSITGGSYTNADLLETSFGIGISSNRGRWGGTAITDWELFVYERTTNELTNTFQYIGGSSNYVPIVVDIGAGSMNLSNLASVSDTRMVTNLNAEFLGGLPASDYVTGSPVLVESDPIWAAASDLYARVFVPVPSISNYLFFAGNGSLEGCLTNGAGSGFPLTKSESAAWYSITNIGVVVASNGQFEALETSSATINGPLDINSGNVDIVGNVSIKGDLTVTGITWNITVINQITNVLMGTITNWFAEDRHWTSYWYSVQYTNIITTNNVTTYILQSGSLDATNATYVWLPGLYIVGGIATATGIWDFSSASVTGLPDSGSSGTQAEYEPYIIAAETDVTIALENWRQSYTPTGDTTIALSSKENITNIASVRLDLDLANWGTVSFATNNMTYNWTSMASGSTHTLLFDCQSGTTNWTGRELE